MHVNMFTAQSHIVSISTRFRKYRYRFVFPANVPLQVWNMYCLLLHLSEAWFTIFEITF